MKSKRAKNTFLTVLKRTGQLILTIFIVRVLAFLFNFSGLKLDDNFVFSKRLDCPPWFRFGFNYAFALLCLACFIRIVILAKHKKISKFWIFDGLVALVIVGFSLQIPIWATYNSIKYENALPVVLRVFPGDQTYVFYEGQIPEDKKETLTGFVIQKDNPVPVRYENGRIKEYIAGNKWYSADDIEYNEDKLNATHKITHEPVTGFVMFYGQRANVLLEYFNGKFTRNRFVFNKEDGDTTGKLDTWLYLKDGIANVNYEGFYPNGYLTHKSKSVKGKAIIDWYLPNGQLILKTVNQNLGADNPWVGVASLQQAYYNSKGELVGYWDMRHGTALCVSPDGKGRQMMPTEIQRFFDEADKIPGGKIPDFRCERK